MTDKEKWDRGERPRWFHERAKIEAQQGSPLRKSVSDDTRPRLVREIQARSFYLVEYADKIDFYDSLLKDIYLVFGSNPRNGFGDFAVTLDDMQFLGLLELCVNTILHNRKDLDDLKVMQSLLADDLCAFRLRDHLFEDGPDFQIELIDNPHLEREVVDRTFELTRNAAFDS